MPTITRSVDLAVVGANGGGWVTDQGAAIPAVPAAFDSTPHASLLPVGAISEDGLVYGFAEDNQTFIAWGQLTPFRAQITKSERSFQVTMWETNRAIVKSVMYRLPVADVTADGSGDYSFEETSQPAPDRRSWLFDVIDGETLERYFVPVGEVTNRTDVTFKSGEMAGYGLTITAYADSTGVTVYHLGHVELTGS